METVRILSSGPHRHTSLPGAFVLQQRGLTAIDESIPDHAGDKQRALAGAHEIVSGRRLRASQKPSQPSGLSSSRSGTPIAAATIPRTRRPATADWRRAGPKTFPQAVRTRRTPFDKFYLNIQKYGNIPTASWAAASEDAVRDGFFSTRRHHLPDGLWRWPDGGNCTDKVVI